MTSENLFKTTVVLLGIPAALLLVLLTAAALIVFLMLGGGWAYAGPAGCHFKLNPLGIATVTGGVLGAFVIFYKVGRRIVLRYHSH
jgi:hypothetical protein